MILNNLPSAIYLVLLGQHSTENSTSELSSEERKAGTV